MQTVKKKIKQYKAEKSLPYLEGDYLAQALRIAQLLDLAVRNGTAGSHFRSKELVNQACIHLNRLVNAI